NENPDVLEGVYQGQPGTLEPLTDDVPGRTVTDDLGTFDPDSLRFPTGEQPAGSQLGPDGKSIVVPGEGTWAIEPEGVVTFQPVPEFHGPTTPVHYEVTDSLGIPTGSTLTAVVVPVNPTA